MPKKTNPLDPKPKTSRPVRVKNTTTLWSPEVTTPKPRITKGKKAAKAPIAKKKGSKASPKKRSTKEKGIRKTKPSYEKMILKALNNIGKRGGSSSIAIANYIKANYPVPVNVSRYLRIALKKALDAGSVVKASLRTYRANSLKIKGKKRRTTKKSTTPKKRTSVKTRVPSTTSKRKATKEKKVTKVKPVKAPRKQKTAKIVAASAPTATPAAPTGLRGEYLWQYDHNGWKNYTVEASNVVEDVYTNYLSNRGDTDVRAVKSGQWEYLVDFMAMKQTNIQHEAHTTRNIRRIKVA